MFACCQDAEKRKKSRKPPQKLFDVDAIRLVDGTIVCLFLIWSTVSTKTNVAAGNLPIRLH